MADDTRCDLECGDCWSKNRIHCRHGRTSMEGLQNALSGVGLSMRPLNEEEGFAGLPEAYQPSNLPQKKAR